MYVHEETRKCDAYGMLCHRVKNMNSKNRLKRIIDILMTIVLLFLMAYQVTDERNHEWLGAGMLVLFLLHNMPFPWAIQAVRMNKEKKHRPR